MGLSIGVTVEDAAVQRSLDRLASRMVDLRPVFEQIADDFHQMESRLFASHGSSAGEPWQPSQQGGAVTLTGQRERMKRSLTVPRSRNSVQRITRNSITLGSTQPLAHLHQGGTADRYVRTYRGKPLAKPRYAGRLPRRAVFAVGAADEQRWAEMVSAHVLAGVDPIGL